MKRSITLLNALLLGLLIGLAGCKPTAQAVLYNNISTPKKIIFHQGIQHPHPMPDGKAYSFSSGWR